MNDVICGVLTFVVNWIMHTTVCVCMVNTGYGNSGVHLFPYPVFIIHTQTYTNTQSGWIMLSGSTTPKYHVGGYGWPIVNI